jgi:hypothetical protein
MKNYYNDAVAGQGLPIILRKDLIESALIVDIYKFEISKEMKNKMM